MPESKKPIVVWHAQAVTRTDREKLNKHRGCVVWFTGLSGSGKSTVANLVDQKLHKRRARSYVLDGDNVRHGLNATPQLLAERYGDEFANRFGLGFSQQDREENIRRVGAVAALLCDAGLITLTAFVSPFRADRDTVRASLGDGDFIEVYVNASLETCESRDPKGLYKKHERAKSVISPALARPTKHPSKPKSCSTPTPRPPSCLPIKSSRCLPKQASLASLAIPPFLPG